MLGLHIWVSIAVVLFAVFPLTDTDIWWHLACAREWVTTWTPVREPVVHVHEFFQQTVAFVYNIGGASLLVSFKALLWGVVFFLFLWPLLRSSKLSKGPVTLVVVASVAILLYVFRYQFEIRPVLFSLLFLGVYWNVLPWLLRDAAIPYGIKKILAIVLILVIQWIWCKCQGLYILGPLFAFLVFVSVRKAIAWQAAFILLLFAMPFLHRDGMNLFLYPFGLLDRLLGLSPSAAIFASEIAENRSPVTLLLNGENVIQSVLMIVLCMAGTVVSCATLFKCFRNPAERFQEIWKYVTLLVTASLAFVAERNFVLFLPVLVAIAIPAANKVLSKFCQSHPSIQSLATTRIHQSSYFYQLCSKLRFPTTFYLLFPILVIAFLLGFWTKSLASYDRSMIAFQRVPVAATAWMVGHPHPGRLFNDDRAGGYLAFMNPSDSTYIDGRFILKTADFFERYLEYSETPSLFLRDADSLDIDRVVLPLRYYARWNGLLMTLDSAENWHVVYRDSLFVVMDRTKF